MKQARAGSGTTIAPLWTVEDVATYLRVPVRTVYTWRTQGGGPPGRRVGKYVRFDPSDVVAWFENNGAA
jgi:excisionase family DNA binding protein